MTKKSGRYKPGARSIARFVKKDKEKWEKKTKEDKRAAEAVEKSAEEKRGVEKRVAEAVEAEKIMEERCKLAEKKIKENEKKKEEMKKRAAEAVEKSAGEKRALGRRVEDAEEGCKRMDRRLLFVEKQWQLALADNEVLQSENSALKKKLSQLAVPPSWAA